MKRRLALGFVLILLAVTPGFAQTELEGETSKGAFYKIVVPDEWNGDLIIWNHGFSLSPAGPVDFADLMGLDEIVLLEGFAIGASSYRQAGWAVFKTNNDLRAVVDALTAEFESPDRVFLAGASLGGIVNAAAIEKGNLGNLVGALTLCGAVAGSRNWDGSLDLRLLYDFVCADVPGAAIPGGAKGLPKNTDWIPEDVDNAVNACTGILERRADRTRKQKKRLKKLLRLAQIPKQFLLTDMWYATFGMADLVHSRGKLRGKIGMGNDTVDYGDDEVNAEIERAKPKKRIARRLGKNYTPSGKVGDTKIVALHTDKDGLTIVENLSEYASVVPAENLTVGVVVEETPSHCDFSPAEAIGAWESLQVWVDDGVQPTAADLQAACEQWVPLIGGPCRIDPDFEIPDMNGRIRPR